MYELCLRVQSLFFLTHQLTGYIISSIIWEEVLENVFAQDVSGIECILETETQNHSYGIENGKPKYM